MSLKFKGGISMEFDEYTGKRKQAKVDYETYIREDAEFKNTLPEEYRRIWEDMLMPVDTNIQLSDVLLSDENKKKINVLIQETKYRDKLLKRGLTNSNRILMYGASGTGKTFLSRALSRHLGYTMLYVDIAKALTDDTVARNISDIFKLSNYLGNCLIFFDECDAIAWNRDATSNVDSGTIRRATNSIFQYLDQMNPSNIFVSCTNMLHRLDVAFERRFHIKMEFRRPPLSEGDNLDTTRRHFLYDSFFYNDDVDETTRRIVKTRLKDNVKLSYYEIEEIVKTAMKRSVLNDTDQVNSQDIYEDIAFAMNIKLTFHTEKDSEEIFHNEAYY